LTQAKAGWILLAITLYVIDYFVRSIRWAVLIKPIRTIPAQALYWPLLIGFFANNVLPLRMGEFVRAHICGTKFKISRTASLGTILIERIFDTLSFLTTFLIVALIYPFPRFVEKGAIALGVACFGVIATLLLIRKHENRFHQLLERLGLPSAWKSRVRDITTHFLHSISGITRPRYLAEAMALSLTVWIMEGTFIFLMARAFTLPLLYAQSFFLLFVLGLSVTLPQAPGAVGTFEFFGVMALSFVGIAKEQALPLILAIHGTQFIFIAALGMIGLWKEGLTFRSLTSTS